eukprot:TRINITY_DN42122_c0_g1_i1.p1 TRINITY_DN42122_c0_g1~~TRINITY_DN42122_c0_g1_i1.p1  ORF type:complete len:567 (+),score=70.47 TRINITY_DN42122_c0_g1_i1:84-1784(+)
MGQCCSEEAATVTGKKKGAPPEAKQAETTKGKDEGNALGESPSTPVFEPKQVKEEGGNKDTPEQTLQAAGGNSGNPGNGQFHVVGSKYKKYAYPIFRSDTSLNIGMLIASYMTKEITECLQEIGKVELPLSSLLITMLQVGHTAACLKEGKTAAAETFTSEKKLEDTLFGSTVAVERQLKPEILILLFRWYHSAPLLIKRGKVFPVIPTEEGQDKETSFEEKQQAAGRILSMLKVSQVESLSYGVKIGMRTAVKKYALCKLDGRKEQEIRRAQELRRTSWWQELSGKDIKEIEANANLDSFNAWRRKTITGNQSLLSPISSTNSDGTRLYTIVLDLDETLIYTRGNGSHLCLRPGSEELLRCLRRLGCNVVVWTASTKDYSAAILSNIDPELQYVSECVYRHNKWFEGQGMTHPRKDLSLLGRDLDNTLIVDNSVDCCVGYTETNAIIVPDFRGLELEETLPTLCEFFVDLVESQVSVKDYLYKNGHKYFKLEKRMPSSPNSSPVQCFVVDARHDTEQLKFSVTVEPAPHLTLIPTEAKYIENRTPTTSAEPEAKAEENPLDGNGQ